MQRLGLTSLNLVDDTSGGSPPAGGSSMQDVISSCSFDCDATIEDSTSGLDGNMLNLVTSPTSGSQADYDMLGSGGMTSADFVGTAGDSGAYFNKAAGGEYFDVRTIANTFLADMPATGTEGISWWIAAVYRNASGANQAVWGQSYLAADTGIYFLADDTGFRRIYHANGSSLSNIGSSIASQDYTTTTDVCFIISADMTATTANARFWMNGNFLELPWTIGSTNQALSADNSFFFGATDSNTSPPRAGISSGRMYAISGGNSFLTQAEMDSIGAEYETRHARTY